MACVATLSGAAPVVSSAPVVLPMDVSPVEPGRKQCHIEFLGERARMFAAFEDIWASVGSFSMLPGPSSAPRLLLVNPLVLRLSIPAPVLSVVPVAVLIASPLFQPHRGYLLV